VLNVILYLYFYDLSLFELYLKFMTKMYFILFYFIWIYD